MNKRRKKYSWGGMAGGAQAVGEVVNEYGYPETSGSGGTFGAVTGVVGSLIGIGDAIADPIRQDAEAIDPLTGRYKDYAKAYKTAQIGAFADPFKAATDKYAKPWEKVAGALGWGAAFQKDIYKRKEAAMMDKVRGNTPVGASFNPYANPTMPYGGMVGSDTVELEDGEVFRTPDGQMQNVNGNTHAQGGELYNLPTNTQILGKKQSKIYGEKFKVLGQKLKSMQSKYDKVLDSDSPPIAKRTAKLMLDRVQKEYTALMQEQESAKAQAYQKKFPNGGITSPLVWDMLIKDETVYPQYEYNGKPMYALAGTNNVLSRLGKDTFELGKAENKRGEIIYGTHIDPTTDSDLQYANRRMPARYTENIMGEKYINPYDPMLSKYNRKAKFADGGYLLRYGAQKNRFSQPTQYDLDLDTNLWADMNYAAPFERTNPLTTPTIKNPAATPTTSIPTTKKNSVNWGNVAGTIGSLAPVLYNAIQGARKEPEFEYQDYVNPYIDEIRSDMRNRRYNIDPLLESNRLGQATYSANLRRSAPSQSQLLAGLQAGATGRHRADAMAYAQKQNIDNQYLGDQAQMDYNLGQGISQTKMAGYDINLRNDAARRNFMGTAASQLSQMTQMKQLQNNQMVRDLQKMGLLKDLYSDFTMTPGGWMFNQTGEVMNEQDAKNYIIGKYRR